MAHSIVRSRVSRVRKWTAGILASVAVLLPPSNPSEAVEPATVAAFAMLASSALSLGSSRSDVRLEIALASLQMIKEVHVRLDGIEDALAEILSSVTALPERFREALQEDSDIDRAENVLGITDSIVQRMEIEQQRASPSPDAESQAVLDLTLLRHQRNSLFRRSDAVAPTLVTAFVVELAALTSLPGRDMEVVQLLRDYDRRFAEMENEKRVGSLAWSLQHLLDEQRGQEKEIAKVLGSPGEKLEAGMFPWFSQTLMKVERQRFYFYCGGPHRIPTTGSAAQPTEHLFLYQIYHQRCWRDQDVPVPVSTTIWQRKVTIGTTPSDLGVFYLKVESIPETIAGGIDGIPRYHSPEYENRDQKMQTDHVALINDVRGFTARTEAILNVQQVLNLVKIARQAIRSADPGALAQVQDAADRVSPVIDLQAEAARQAEHLAAAQRAIGTMKAGRVEAWERMKDAELRIKKAYDDAERDKWRNDVRNLLGIAAASAQAMSAVNAEIASARMAAAAEVAEAAAQMDQADTPEAPPSSVSSGTDQAAGKAPPLTTSIIERPPAKSDDTRLDKIRRVATIAEAVDDRPASTYASLPSDHFTPTEAQIGEGLALLDELGPTVADLFVDENSKSVREILTDATLEGLLSGDVMEGIKSVGKAAITPTPLADGTLESLSYQNHLRARLSARLGEFLEMREPSLDIEEATRIWFEQAERCKNNCLTRD